MGYPSDSSSSINLSGHVEKNVTLYHVNWIPALRKRLAKELAEGGLRQGELISVKTNLDNLADAIQETMDILDGMDYIMSINVINGNFYTSRGSIIKAAFNCWRKYG
ncbi:hypothetical protein EUX98_g5202 [Antrodiella citrinella]|uniref:Uncharacterized protein n=1 Tax=Antrodiella citrinella TaxID=2447956 RepID=A0A4S4MS45_9APHY|nr:hypothetical protein EUX98_g5202 [Antrodiella citrinella]